MTKIRTHCLAASIHLHSRKNAVENLPEIMACETGQTSLFALTETPRGKVSRPAPLNDHDLDLLDILLVGCGHICDLFVNQANPFAGRLHFSAVLLQLSHSFRSFSLVTVLKLFSNAYVEF